MPTMMQVKMTISRVRRVASTLNIVSGGSSLYIADGHSAHPPHQPI